MGYQAGQNNQGSFSVAIGAYAGNTGQSYGSIVINATGTGVTGYTGSCHIAPIRNIEFIGNSALLTYNTTSSEINYANSVTLSGTVAAQSYFSTSDRRLKTNIQPFPNVLDKVNQIHPVQFEWKAEGKKDYGFIAQEFFQKMDFLHSAHNYTGIEELKDASGSDVFYFMEYAKITAILCKAVQELSEKVAILEKRLDERK